MIRQLILIISIISCTKTARLPSYFSICRRTLDTVEFDKCALDNLKSILPHLRKGDKSLGIPPLDPFKIKEMAINSSGMSIVLNDLVIDGIDTVKPTLVSHNFDQKKILVELYADKIAMNSKYSIDGTIAVVPISGNGDSKIDVDGIKVMLNLFYHLKDKKGTEYMEIDLKKSTVDFTVKKTHVYFSNLFGGNEQLEKSTNDLLNEQWEKVLEEIKPAVSQSVLTIALTIMHNLFEKFPIDTLFPK